MSTNTWMHMVMLINCKIDCDEPAPHFLVEFERTD